MNHKLQLHRLGFREPPFGMQMPGRGYRVGSGYRYGFNGKEKDKEVKGEGNQIDYNKRIYDPRISRFYSLDPLQSKFPFYSPYQFAGNTPIQAIDVDGAEEFHYLLTFDKQGRAQLTFMSQNDYKYAEWTPTLTDLTKKTVHVNEEQRYYVHTGTYYTGTIENGSRVQFLNQEVAFSYGSTKEFNENAPNLTAQDVQSKYNQLEWSTYALKGLNNVAEEFRQGHIPGTTKSRAPTSATNQQATAANGGTKFGGRTIVVDENLSPTIATKLAEQGYNVKTFVKGTTDADIITWAKKNNGVVLTNNIKDFKNQGVMSIEVPVSMSTRDKVDKVVSSINTLNRNIESHGNNVYSNNSTLNLEKDAQVMHR